jgi:thiamine-monophosphate kinase
VDEFESIARLFRPLAEGAPEALGLADDAALLPQRPGFELVVTTDALVEGVHFLASDPPGMVAQKLLRVNLSDLAAKAAEPYGYLLTTAWPPEWNEQRRAAFARGLAEDQARFGLRLFGGDTVSTPGPLTVSAAVFGWVEAGRMVKRSGARAGDVLFVSGTIGDGWLGLKAATGALDASAEDRAYLARRYRLPEPRLGLRDALGRHASAAADVSDGLLADAGRIGEASGVGVEVELGRLPLSAAAARAGRSLIDLATGGDDYEIVCTARPEHAAALEAAAEAAGAPITRIGGVMDGQGVSARLSGQPVALGRTGWRHG